MQRGTVKWFSRPKGYGFIKRRGKTDLFVHASAILMPGFKVLQAGDRVAFGEATGPRGPVARDVKKLRAP